MADKATLGLTRPKITLNLQGDKSAHVTLVTLSKAKEIDLTKSTRIAA